MENTKKGKNSKFPAQKDKEGGQGKKSRDGGHEGGVGDSPGGTDARCGLMSGRPDFIVSKSDFCPSDKKQMEMLREGPGESNFGGKYVRKIYVEGKETSEERKRAAHSGPGLTGRKFWAEFFYTSNQEGVLPGTKQMR